MARTRLTAGAETLDEAPLLENDDHSSRGAEALSFKGSLERFKHQSDATPAPNALLATTPITRSGRKRALDDDDDDSRAPPTQSPTPTKRRRQSSKYAPPSKYAHLAPLVDILAPNLICIFVGTNPGVRTATTGHAYSHPSNSFWKLLHSSGCTTQRLQPAQDVDLPRLYGMGNTNIVARPSRDAAELSKAEMAAGTPILEAKVRKFRPEAVCIVGKGIWEAVWRWRYKREIRKDEFKYGWQEEREWMGKAEEWAGARVFVTSSTSGLSASTKPHEKEAIWRPFGEWVKKRREERAAEVKCEES